MPRACRLPEHLQCSYEILLRFRTDLNGSDEPLHFLRPKITHLDPSEERNQVLSEVTANGDTPDPDVRVVFNRALALYKIHSLKKTTGRGQVESFARRRVSEDEKTETRAGSKNKTKTIVVVI